MRGHPPTPIEQKIAMGNPGRRPLPEVVVGLGKVETIEKPADLDERAGVVWDELVPQIMQLGWIDAIDARLIRQYIELTALADRAYEQLMSQPLVFSTKKRAGVNPAHRVYMDASKQAIQISDRFGFTPSARARLGYTAIKGMSLAADFERRMSEVPETIEVNA